MRHSRQQQKSVIAALTDSRQKTRVNHFQARPCPIKIKHKSSFLIQHQKKELDLWKSFYCFRIFFTIEKFHQSPWLEFITWRLSLQWRNKQSSAAACISIVAGMDTRNRLASRPEHTFTGYGNPAGRAGTTRSAQDD